MKLNFDRSKVFAVITVIVVISLVSSLFFYLNSQNPYTGNVEPVVYGDLVTGSSALIYVAQDQHFFTENGINFTIQKYAAGPNTINATINNQMDVAYSTEFGFMANSVLKNESLSVVATVDKFVGYFLVVRKDLGIENPSDLNGKRIGVTAGTISQFYLGQFLELNAIDADNVTIVDIPFSQTVNAIVNGTVDAVVTYSPVTDQIQAQLTNNVAMWSVQSSQIGYGLIFCRSSWVSQHPDLVVRFLKALNQAENYLNNNPSAAENIVQKALNRTDTEISELWSQVNWSLSLDQSLILAMENEARWMINSNLTNETAVPNFQDYLYLQGLMSVKPGSVNIIH